MTHHNLKCASKQYAPVANGSMTSIVRYNDRNYQIGDSVTLNEGDHSVDGFQYTGRNTSAIISYIDDYGCQYGYVNLSLQNVGLLVADDLPEILKEQA